MPHSESRAVELDAADPLASFRQAFLHGDEDLIYLDGNSLGRLPARSLSQLETTLQREWGERLIRSWNESWMALPIDLGTRIAPLVGARGDEVLLAETTSLNLFKLAGAMLQARPGRRKIVSDLLNFPSDLYVLQGLVRLLGNRHELVLVPSQDGVAVAEEEIEAALDEQTALVVLSQVSFKSGFLYDVDRITDAAHRHGAFALWDLSHSVGALPIELDAWRVDGAVGCAYKYLNGGPGCPAFLYLRRDLQAALEPPIQGWFGSRRPFDFDPRFEPAPDLKRFWVSTPPVLSMAALGPALDLVHEAGIERLREKSLRQTEYLIELADAWLASFGFELGTPRAPERRGSHVSLRHSEAYRIAQALIHPARGGVRVLPDFRAPDNLRLGIAPLYTRFIDIHRAMGRIRQVVQRGEHLAHPPDPDGVT